MKADMLKRGPNDHGTHSCGGVAFGHRRLSIIDLTKSGAQPMVDGDWMLVFNGCIYNYKELREEMQLRGVAFSSTSDTEVLLRAWQVWGEEALKKLDGMFAFAIYDPRERTTFLCRDRFGIKPLYYSINQQRLRFASTLPALIKTEGIDKSINSNALHFMYSLHAVVPAPDTIVKGVKKLPPAHYMRIDNNGEHTIKPYWVLETTVKNDEKDWQGSIESLLKKAVKKRLMAADVPVGVLLSGGLDSSLIVSLVEEVRQDLKQQGQEMSELLTFSIGFEDIGKEQGNEFYYSDQVVSAYHSKHQRIHIPNTQVLQRLGEAIECMSEPMFGQDAIAFYLLAEQVSQHVKVVLSGQGADEVFGGYFWYPQMMQFDHQNPDKEAVEKFAPFYVDREWSEMQQMLNTEWLADDPVSPWINQRLGGEFGNGHGDFINRVLGLDMTTLIVDDPVKRVDNMTMGFSLEARVPFLDTSLVEYAACTSGAWRLQNNGKHPLKVMAEKYFSKDFIYRKKGYFPMPALKNVRGSFLDWMNDILHSQQCIERGIFNRKYIDKLLKDPENSQNFTRLQGSKLWHISLLEAWLQTHKI